MIVKTICPVCGAEMKIKRLERGASAGWIKYKCTCGHTEDRKDDGSYVLMTHSLLAIDGFHEFPSKGE
jgi:hypothetical protein